MKLVRWSFNNLHLPMMEDAQGKLYCTNQAITQALGLSEATLWKMYERHKGEFDGLSLTQSHAKADGSVTQNHAKEFLKKHKTEFGICRLRNDMRLWSEDDMILIAVLSHSPAGADFRRGVLQLIKRNARKEYISKEQYEADIANLKTQIQELKDIVQESRPALQRAASAAGTALAAQRGVKHLRLVKAPPTDNRHQ